MMMVAPVGYRPGGSTRMAMGAPAIYSFGVSTDMFLFLSLGNHFRTWEGYFVEILIGSLGGLIIGTSGVYFVGISLILSIVFALGMTRRNPLGYLLEYKNPVAVIYYLFGYLVVINPEVSIGNPLGSLLDYIWNVNWCGPWLGYWK